MKLYHHPLSPNSRKVLAVAKHLGLQAETGPAATFIHAYSGHGVVESALTPPWERRIVARFALPERT